MLVCLTIIYAFEAIYVYTVSAYWRYPSSPHTYTVCETTSISPNFLWCIYTTSIGKHCQSEFVALLKSLLLTIYQHTPAPPHRHHYVVVAGTEGFC